MEVDIVKRDFEGRGDEEVDFAVYPRTSFHCLGYEGAPLFVSKDEGECWNFCDEQKHSHRYRRFVRIVPDKYVRDLERKCDRKFIEILDLGCKVESDITYRESAAWKESPIHYGYCGDMGGFARVVRGEADDDAMKVAKRLLNELCAMADAVWELGFTLTFGADGKHKIFGTYPEWVTLDNDE